MKRQAQTEMKTTAKQRRAAWNPRKWANKHLNDGGGMKTEQKNVFGPIWEGNPESTCAKCGTSHNKIEGVEYTDKWLCNWCDWSIPKKGLRVKTRIPLSLGHTYYLGEELVKLKSINFDQQRGTIINQNGDTSEILLDTLDKVIEYKMYDNTWIGRIKKWWQLFKNEEERNKESRFVVESNSQEVSKEQV